MRIGMVAAVLTLLVAEGGALWYLAGERVARAPDELLTMARLQHRFDAAKRRAAPGLTQLRRTAVPVNSTVTSAPKIPQVPAGQATESSSSTGSMQGGMSAVPVNSTAIAVLTFPQISTDRPVVGLEFRLSPSVVEECQRALGLGCRQLGEFINEMAHEWPDPMWAADMEARLSQLVTRGDRHNYRIRSLECRSTRCAIEVASEVDYARVSLVSDDVLDRALRWSGFSAAAWEENPSGGRTTIVTVAAWERRR
jgi:hypothetical protein